MGLRDKADPNFESTDQWEQGKLDEADRYMGKIVNSLPINAAVKN